MSMKQIVMGIIALMALTGCGSEGISTSLSGASQSLSESERALYLKVINDARAIRQNCHTKGVFDPAPPLKWNEALYKAALEHSEDMAKSNTFSHTGSGTASDLTGQEYGSASSVDDRIENNGYSNWRAYGENIAAGTTMDTPQKAIAAWLQSDGHCANIMNPNFKEVGMAHFEESGSHYTHYWTQDFGAR